MAISPKTQRVLDNYAASVGGVQDTRHTLKDTSQEASPFLRALAILGSLTLLTACTTAPAASSSTPSLKEKTVTTANNTTAPKRIMDGSRPFTLPEIEERLLKVLALPPAQISKESVEKAFGFILENEEIPNFYEERPSVPPTAFLIEVPKSYSSGTVFRYLSLLRKTQEDGKEVLIDKPREIPAAYKFAYSDFVQKLEKFGWENKGLDSDLGNHSNYFMKEGFLLTVHMDDYRRDANGQPDFSQTRISRVVIHASDKR